MEKKEFCKKGHKLSETRIVKLNGKGSKCRLCEYERHMDYQCRTRYGLSLKQRDELLESQGNACKLCKRTDCGWGKGFQNVWHIDHTHGTNIVRGILCASCNMLVGQIEKNLILSKLAFDYLTK